MIKLNCTVILSYLY